METEPVTEEQMAKAAATILAGVPIIAVALDRLCEPVDNPNQMSPDDFARLVEAIRKFGFLQPVLVRAVGNDFELVDGVHRVRAAREAGLTEVPCVLADSVTAGEARALQIGMNKLRGELNLADVAASIASLVEEGWTTDELTVTGYSEEEIAELIKVATTDDEDALAGASATAPEEPVEQPPKPYVLELEFATRAELQRVKRVLRKAAGGKGKPLSDGMLALVEGA